MKIRITRMAIPLYIGFAFGLFFVQACTTVQPTETPEYEPGTAQYLEAELNRLNDQLAENPGTSSLYLEKSEVLYEFAKTHSPRERPPIYQNLKDHSDAAMHKENIDQNEIEDVLRTAWSEEQSRGVQLLQQDRSTGLNENYSEIIAHFDNAITVIPDSLVTYSLKATTLYESGNLGKSIETLEKANTLSGGSNTEFLEKLAYLYLESGDVEKSISMYETLVESNPDDQHLKHGLVNAYIIDNQHEEAIAILSELTDLFPSRHTYQETLATQIYFLFDLKADDLIQQDYLDSEKSEDIQEISLMADQVHLIFDEIQATMPINEENTYRMAAFYKDAYLTLSKLTNRIEFDSEIVEVIISQKEQFLGLSLPLWERLAELNPDNLDYLNHLYQVYLHLDMEEDAQSLERSLNF